MQSSETATSQQPQHEQQIKAVVMKMTKTEFITSPDAPISGEVRNIRVM